MFQMKSIQAKIMIWAGACLLVTAAILTTYAAINMRNKAMDSAKQSLIAESKSYAASIDAEMQIPLDTARSLAQAISSKIKLNSTETRENVTAMLKELLVQNPSFLGVSTEWEPNVFDAVDAVYAGRENVAPDGHFSPYWVRDGDLVSLTFLPRLAENDPAYAYYTVPKALTLQEVVIEPYLYPSMAKMYL